MRIVTILLAACLFVFSQALPALAQDQQVAELEEPKKEQKKRRRNFDIDELTEDERQLLEFEQESNSQDEDTENLPFSVPVDISSLPKRALIVTSKGPFEVQFFVDKTPVSVANFKYLVEKDFYEGLKFHRYVPGFVIQGGDPTGTTRGGPGWTLPQEIDPDIKHIEGTIGWARRPARVNPERRSNGSQFYICLQPQPRLDGFYTAFAKVVQGMENVNRLRPGDKILKVSFSRSYRMEQGPDTDSEEESKKTQTE